MITSGYGRFLLCSSFVIFIIVILSCIVNYDRSMHFMAAAIKNSQLNISKTNTGQVTLQERNISSNQSEDIKAIKNSMFQEVQLLKNMTQGFGKISTQVAKTSTQASFASFSIFLFGLTLVLYGLRLTVRATSRETSIIFKAMMWALTTPVIIIIAIYQVGILTGNPFGFVKTNEPFFFISLLLYVPASIIVFLLIAEKRVLSGFHKKQPE